MKNTEDKDEQQQQQDQQLFYHPSLPSTTSTSCWVEWDVQKKQFWMDLWLQHQVPLLVMAVVEMKTVSQNQQVQVQQLVQQQVQQQVPRTTTPQDTSFTNDGNPPTKTTPTTPIVAYIILTQSYISGTTASNIDYNDNNWTCLYTNEYTDDTTNDSNDSNDSTHSIYHYHHPIVINTTTSSSLELSASFAPRHPKKGRDNLVLTCPVVMLVATSNPSDQQQQHHSNHHRIHYLYAIRPPLLKTTTTSQQQQQQPPISTVQQQPFRYYDLRHSLQCSIQEAIEIMKCRLDNDDTTSTTSTSTSTSTTTFNTSSSTILSKSTYNSVTSNTSRQHQQQQHYQQLYPSSSINNNNNNNTSTTLQLGACLRFRGDFDRSILPQWVEYHRLVGIDHFWIFINEPWNLEGLYNRSYITYYPLDQQWNYHPQYYQHYYHRDISQQQQQQHQQQTSTATATSATETVASVTLSQEPAQTTCLYIAKTQQYDWIITTDVDEYLYLPKQKNQQHQHQQQQQQQQPLKSFLQRFDKEQYSSLIINSIPFGKNVFIINDTDHDEESQQQQQQQQPQYNSTTNNNTIIQIKKDDRFLMLDYVWRRNWNLTEYPFVRYKQLYNVAKVWSIGIHYCHAVTPNTKSNVQLHPTIQNDYIHLAHYKRAHLGVFKKGQKLMIKSEQELRKDTIVRDTYRTELLQRLQELEQII
ncbi:hypothetical protein IV203_012799 [Nitzschia inconspicua]|uniref:Glycosyltransferase family 92 protein n=1 Tax=Nitzschia inconspicua TaxID=303405 RepID=A0A9K3M4I1_9STRA|nr:hypothetical protein IV203_012750 [Nitzschia inconspicua]KAG7350032.1 hypothetical protein IV203_012629 [Nitzschia inconspicua]KAG7373704.1 hypothetical protein IV203_012799 [Nitzschia inconspicua]